jgi:hypothetical protein
MSSNKVKVVGYAQRIFYNDGIEYRNFSPDLVGVQLTSDGGSPLMTMGNFSITTNLDPKLDKTFITNKFSNFVTLANLNLSVAQTQTLLANNAEVVLNLDKSNLGYYALFGSLSEFVRVSLEDIITNWPASLYLSQLAQTDTGQMLTGYTVENYSYDTIGQISSFKINTTFINNKFGINYTNNGNIISTFSTSNDLRNMTAEYASYAVLYNGVEFDVLSLVPSTNLINDYIYLQVQGNPFSGVSSGSTSATTVSYHIKPKKIIEEQFFNSIPDFESYILNRQIIPAYTSSFRYPTKSDEGVIIYVTDTVTWPVTDGYNIDFDSTAYVSYATKLLDIANNSDLFSSDLMYRFLVSESISNFDTVPVHLDPIDEDTSGQKMTKTLRIYGREFDEINKYITGIEFAHIVTYNKQDNTPDVYLKDLARVLGWNLISSVAENDLLANYVTTAPSTYTGMTVGYTAEEADVELWRRIILNTPWIWKSKGARKSIEFLLRFIGAPQGLIQFNEYIYRANAPIDVDLFKQLLVLNGLTPDLTLYPIDNDGYPNPLPDTPDMYFQNNGLWYRETGGSGSTIDILEGNNPHVGPYDGGFKYINQFRTLIPNFSAVTVSSVTTTTGATNLFTNYSLGSINNYSGATYVDGINEDGSDLSGCYVITSSIIPDPMPSDYITDCGCESAADDDALSICVSGVTATQGDPCSNVIAVNDDTTDGLYVFSYYQYNEDGSILVNSSSNPIPYNSDYATQECCLANGGIPWIYNQTETITVSGLPTGRVGQIQSNNSYTKTIVTNSGYVCCDATGNCGCTVSCAWVASITPIYLPPITSTYSGPQSAYLNFTEPDGTKSIVMPDGCNCLQTYTIAVPNITDPISGQIGTACQLTPTGVTDIALGYSSQIYNFYSSKANGNISCSRNTIS